METKQESSFETANYSGHTEPVKFVLVWKGNLVTASEDKKIIVWEKGF